jgi:hypothetical protein
MFMYHYEHVVIGPVAHAYAWRATADKLCPTMVLRPHLPAPNRGSRKVVAGWEWFEEPPNNKFDALAPRGKIVSSHSQPGLIHPRCVKSLLESTSPLSFGS